MQSLKRKESFHTTSITHLCQRKGLGHCPATKLNMPTEKWKKVDTMFHRQMWNPIQVNHPGLKNGRVNSRIIHLMTSLHYTCKGTTTVSPGTKKLGISTWTTHIHHIPYTLTMALALALVRLNITLISFELRFDFDPGVPYESNKT